MPTTTTVHRIGATKLTKTEEKLLSEIDASYTGRTCVDGVRKLNAMNKLIKKGLVRVAQRNSGWVYTRLGKQEYSIQVSIERNLPYRCADCNRTIDGNLMWHDDKLCTGCCSERQEKHGR